jgi:hypothetical protein
MQINSTRQIAAARRADPASLLSWLDRPPFRSGPVLAVVEGVNDIDLMRRISHVLNQEDPKIVNLAALEQRRQLVFIPQGGR